MNPAYQPKFSAPPSPVVMSPIPEYSQVSGEVVLPPYPSNVLQLKSEAENVLSQNGWPLALQETLFKNLQKIAIRFFICDDSGSMGTEDGNTTLTYQGKVK